MKFLFNFEKNEHIRATRKIGFEEIIDAVTEGNLLEMEVHHNIKKYPNQSVLYVRIEEEVYAVPFVKEDEETVFLKTMFPSRKARKRFLGK